MKKMNRKRIKKMINYFSNRLVQFQGGVKRTNLINRLISYGRGFVPLPNLLSEGAL